MNVLIVFINFEHISEKIKQEEHTLVKRIERLRSLESQYMFKPNIRVDPPSNHYQKKYEYRTVFDSENQE